MTRSFTKALLFSYAFALLFSAHSLARPGQLNLGLNISPYKPNFDASLKTDGSLVTPFYDKTFGKYLPQFGLSLDFHVFDDFGTLTLGANVMYAYGKGKVTSKTDPSVDLNTNSALHILQVTPQLTYVFDPYVDIVPLAPYLRAGITGASYFFTYQGKIDSRALGNEQKESGAGMRFGYTAAGGVLFLLDFLQPQVAQQARGLGAYNHTYLKAEVAYQSITNFGQKGLNLSPKWFGNSMLPLELNFGLVIEFL